MNCLGREVLHVSLLKPSYCHGAITQYLKRNLIKMCLNLFTQSARNTIKITSVEPPLPQSTPLSQSSQSRRSSSKQGPESPSSPDRKREKDNYCHYYVNTEKCDYEERTGNKCRFDHKPAPLCSFGLRCNRNKCMYIHPRINGTNSFLGV